MYATFFKRIFDFTFAVIMFAALAWLILLVVAMYIVSMEFPVFYSQQRIGKKNVAFTIYKFRTLQGNEKQSPEERRFWLGDFLRFFSFDEIPQLWNVLRGEMSMIGPRPLPVEYLPLMNERQRQRHNVRPGITGWAQVNGRTDIPWKRKFELDEYYVRHISVGLDIRIFFRTMTLLGSLPKDSSLKEKKFEGIPGAAHEEKR